MLRGGPQGDSLRAIVRPSGAAGSAAGEDLATREVIRRDRVGYLVLDSGPRGLAARCGMPAATRRHSPTSISFIAVVRQNILAQRLERAGLDPARDRRPDVAQSRVSAERTPTRTRRIGPTERDCRLSPGLPCSAP